MRENRTCSLHEPCAAGGALTSCQTFSNTRTAGNTHTKASLSMVGNLGQQEQLSGQHDEGVTITVATMGETARVCLPPRRIPNPLADGLTSAH